jgi:hypothetical protein
MHGNVCWIDRTEETTGDEMLRAAVNLCREFLAK